MKTLNKAIARSLSSKLIIFLIQFIFLAIYTRIFSPEQFGFIASIQVFVVFFLLLSEIGIGPAIISKEGLADNQRNGIFSVTIVLGAALSVVFYVLSFQLNSFYHKDNYQQIAPFVCIAIFFSAANILPQTALIKDTKFITIACIGIIAECCAFVGVYSLNKLGFGVFSLASRTAIQSIVIFVGTWLASKKTTLGRAYFGSEIHHIKSIVSFSLYQFGFNLINYFSRNLDNILIGKYFGIIPLGIYDKSYQLMRYPLMLTTFAMTPAIQPILTKHRDNKSLIVREHNKLTVRLLALSLPISVYLYANAGDVVGFLFGSQWLAATDIVKILCFIIPTQAVLSTSGAFYQSMNKPNLLFISGLLSAATNITAIILGIYLGKIEYIAIGLVIAFNVNFVQCYYIMFEYCLKNSQKDFWLLILKTALVLTPPCAIYILTASFINPTDIPSTFLRLLVNGIIFISLLLIFIKPIQKILK